MAEQISLVETDLIEEKVQKVMRQTDYTEDVAREKLKLSNYDEILVIKTYLGISDNKSKPIKSVNQEIYKQMRYKLDSDMRNYQERVEKGEARKL